MKPQNPGNLLKFNAQSIFQRHKQPGQDRHPFGLKCPRKRLVPFQIPIDSGGSISWKLVNPADDSGATFTAMNAVDLTVAQDSVSGMVWVEWRGNSDLTVTPDCGFWEAWVTVDGIVYYSEVLHLREDDEPTPVWQMTFGHNTDKGTVLYQNGYQQIFYPTKFAWDRLEINRDEEQVVDGYGNVTLKFSRTTARFRLEVADIPDYAVAFFSKCGDLDTAVFEDGTNTVEMANIDFEHRPQGVGLNIGIFKFDAEVEAFNGCQDNYILLA